MIVSGDASESFSASKFSSFSKSSSFLLLCRVFPELFALEADAEVQRDLRDVLFTQNDLALVLAQDLDPERKALQLLDQHAERLRDAGLERVVALDDRLVRLDAADDVVRLDGQDLLQDVRGAVSLERPHLHLAKPLAAELRLAAQRLLVATQARCVSSTWPRFMRLGPPSGLRTMSTGVPSGRYGMSSDGIIRATTPLLPWRPAILSPAEIFLFCAM